MEIIFRAYFYEFLHHAVLVCDFGTEGKFLVVGPERIIRRVLLHVNACDFDEFLYRFRLGFRAESGLHFRVEKGLNM